MLEALGIKHKKVALYSPSQNGLVERVNKTIKEKLDECLRFGWEVKEVLPYWLMEYRSTPHASTGISPFEALNGRKTRTTLTALGPRVERGKIIRGLIQSCKRRVK